jgi:hypothetical protein
VRSCASFARRSRPEATGSTWEFCEFGQAPPRRPTPGSIAAVTIRSSSARDHPRRRSTDVITSICVFVILCPSGSVALAQDGDHPTDTSVPTRTTIQMGVRTNSLSDARNIPAPDQGETGYAESRGVFLVSGRDRTPRIDRGGDDPRDRRTLRTLSKLLARSSARATRRSPGRPWGSFFHRFSSARACDDGAAIRPYRQKRLLSRRRDRRGMEQAVCLP